TKPCGLACALQCPKIPTAAAASLTRPREGGVERVWSARAGRLTCSSLRLLLESTAMDGGFNVSTLLFLVLAVVIFLKLRSVLGRRTGHEQTRYERYKAQQEASQRATKVTAQDKVVTLPRREREELEPRPVEPAVRTDVEE